jgi:hypothetical protein
MTFTQESHIGIPPIARKLLAASSDHCVAIEPVGPHHPEAQP